MPASVETDLVPASTMARSVAPRLITVVKTKKFALKPMTVDEAALQLSSSKDEFLVFHNAENERTSVVYKRTDKQIGLIEPEY